MAIDNTTEFTGLVSRGDKAINERYRPRTFHEIIGNEATKKALAGWMEAGEKRSRTLLLVGGSGQGKTTIARILAAGLNCEHGDTVNPCCECESCVDAMNQRAMHIVEYNMSALSRKEDADDIVTSMYNSSFTGRNNVYILDEIQSMSTSSQNLMLKMLEDPPEGTYVILCTTNPEKILKTVKTRCEQYEVKQPGLDEIKQLLGAVVKQEMPTMDMDSRKKILEACRGLGYREILMKLEKFIKGGGTGSIEEAFQPDYMALAKAVVAGDCATALKLVEQYEKSNDGLDPEAARRMIRVFLCNQGVYAVKGGKDAYAVKCMQAFRVFDKGFYTDPNPLPTFKADVVEGCFMMR